MQRPYRNLRLDRPYPNLTSATPGEAAHRVGGAEARGRGIHKLVLCGATRPCLNARWGCRSPNLNSTLAQSATCSRQDLCEANRERWRLFEKRCHQNLGF
jgi:hypothetical protein